MNTAQIAIATFVFILLSVFWRLLNQRSAGSTAATRPRPAPTIPRACNQADVRQLLHQMAESCFDAASAQRARPRGDCESIASVALRTQIQGPGNSQTQPARLKR
jgi:hypothetical protein